jgi:hypothetical protein
LRDALAWRGLEGGACRNDTTASVPPALPAVPMEIAGFWRRLGSLVIDRVVTGMVVTVIVHGAAQVNPV